MKVKVGIIGTGNMGKNHVRLVREMVNCFDFVGVYDPDKERIKDLGLENYAFTSEEELIEASEAVIIAAPSSLHKTIAIKVADKDKHLLVEKPIALSVSDAEEIITAFEDKNKVLMVGQVERFNPVILELEKIIENEELLGIHIQRCSSMDVRIKDTDVVYDLMIHDIDIVNNALLPNAEVQDIHAFGKKVYSENNMDYVECLMRFENGVIASVISSRATESKIRKIELHCQNAFIVADLLNRTLTISRKTVYNLNVGYDPVYKQENIIERVFVSNEEPLRAELKHFYDCIVNNTAPKTGGKDVAGSIAILDLIKGEIY